MDDDIRQAFASMMAMQQGIDAQVRASNALQAETSRELRNGLASLDGKVKELTADVGHLKSAVFGADPPSSPPAVSVVRQVSEHDSELATLAGQVVAVSAKADKVIEMQEAQNKVLADQNAVLAAQNATLKKITDSVGGFLGHPMVRKLAWAIGFAVTSWMGTKGWLHQ